MSSTDSSSREASGLQSKKLGRKSLLGEKTDKALQDYLALVRRAGGVVNSSVVIAAAEGIVSRDNCIHLGKYGGHVYLDKKWAWYQMKRMGYSKRKSTKAARKIPMNFEVIKSGLLRKIQYCVYEHDIPKSLIINWDQTGMSIVPSSSWTMAAVGSKQVPLVVYDDKHEITFLLSITAEGMLLPPQVCSI